MQGERFPASGLADLEKELSGFPFKGESLAAATSGFLNTYRACRGKHTLSKMIIDGGSSLLLLMLGPTITIFNRKARTRVNARASELPGKVLFVSMSEKTHYQDMMTAAVSEFRQAGIVGMGLKERERQSQFLPNQYFQKLEIGTFCRFADSVQIANRARAWFGVLARFRSRYNLPWYFVIRSLARLLRTAIGMLSFQEFLSHLRPICVVCDFDRYLGNVPIVVAANNLNILTITLQHGTINRTGWETLPSNYFLSWGENSKSRLTQWHGIEEDKILVCGNLLIAEKMRRDLARQPASHTPSGGQLVVGFASQNYGMGIREDWFRKFVEAVELLQLGVLLKPHPVEDARLYEDHARSTGMLEVVEKNVPIFEFIDRCDVVIGIGSSSVAMEAVSMNKPVVLLVVDDSASSAAGEWADADAVLLAHTSEELRAQLERLQSDSAYYASRVIAGQQFLRQEYESTGKEAARRSRSAINELIEAHAQ